MLFTKGRQGKGQERTRRRSRNQGVASEPTGGSNERKADELNSSDAKDKTEKDKDGELRGSTAKMQAFVGIVAITIGNIAAFITHIDQIRQFVSKLLGTEWVYRFHEYIVY